MSTFRKDKVHALEFGCQAPLRFYEHCSACPRFGAGCPDLELGKEILRGKKRIVYGQVTSVDEVPLGSFKCLAPLYYFEKTRSACPFGPLPRRGPAFGPAERQEKIGLQPS